MLVRVGQRETLPPESAVGKDQERDVFVPGIWGDAWIVRTGNPRIRRVQVIPRIGESEAEIRVFMHNAGTEPREVRCTCRVATPGADETVSAPSTADATLAGGTDAVAHDPREDPACASVVAR